MHLVCIFIANNILRFFSFFAPLFSLLHMKSLGAKKEPEMKRKSRVTLINLWLWHEYSNCVCVPRQAAHTDSLAVTTTATNELKQKKVYVNLAKPIAAAKLVLRMGFLFSFSIAQRIDWMDGFVSWSKIIMRKYGSTTATANRMEKKKSHLRRWPFMHEEERDFKAHCIGVGAHEIHYLVDSLAFDFRQAYESPMKSLVN